MSRVIELPETSRRSVKGFSLIELLFVVTIIGIIAAIAIPSLSRARKSANASSAIQSLRVIVTAEHLYKIKNRSYGSLSDIGGEEAIDSVLASGARSGYTFTLTVSPNGENYTCMATPQDQPEVLDHFFVDESGVIRYNTGAPADATSPPIPR